jgi:2-polyprenyl-6-hydroxyphenyl methylase/3-demethylubiquinone-9 3-methyltransferase
MRAMSSPHSVAQHSMEVDRGERFEFGANWASFLKTIDDARIGRAIDSLTKMLEVRDLAGRSFLDVGSGSGLFSLAARRLGARVHSFDFDPKSVACTAELRRRYAGDDAAWTVEQGSVLDADYLAGLGQFDVVYSWGVLHHTGSMWHAMENVLPLVAPGGRLFIALYNQQGSISRRWWHVKHLYTSSPTWLKPEVAVLVYLPLELRSFLVYLRSGKPHHYFANILHYRRNRGMSWWHDKIDWIGGFPFEVAKPEEVFDFYRRRGCELQRLKTCGGGLGCNEYVFQRKLQTAPVD